PGTVGAVESLTVFGGTLLGGGIPGVSILDKRFLETPATVPEPTTLMLLCSAAFAGGVSVSLCRFHKARATRAHGPCPARPSCRTRSSISQSLPWRALAAKRPAGPGAPAAPPP